MKVTGLKQKWLNNSLFRPSRVRSDLILKMPIHTCNATLKFKSLLSPVPQFNTLLFISERIGPVFGWMHLKLYTHRTGFVTAGVVRDCNIGVELRWIQFCRLHNLYSCLNMKFGLFLIPCRSEFEYIWPACPLVGYVALASSHMYSENPGGIRVIVGFMNIGYVSDTARTCFVTSVGRFF